MDNTEYLSTLEDESIYIFRETVGQFKRPVLLFSGGKDSITLVHLALSAFAPGKVPFPLMHIDTGHNFPEVIAFRDAIVEKYNLELIVEYVEESIQLNGIHEERGKYASRNGLQSITLLEAIDKHKFDACIGGARRDEEKARAKERIFSVRNDFGEWDAKNQRPELFDILNGRINMGENVRVFPISNWTELDVWNYIRENKIDLPPLYFAHERDVFERDNLIWSVNEFVYRAKDEEVHREMVRFRTVGDMTCTAAVRSCAVDLDDVIAEIESSVISERGARIDDKRSSSAMEDRKKEGYF